MPRGDAGTLLSWSLFATFGTAGYEHQSRQWESSGQEGGSGAKQSEARSPTMAPALGWTWMDLDRRLEVGVGARCPKGLACSAGDHSSE